jgi:hypothetical protein
MEWKRNDSGRARVPALDQRQEFERLAGVEHAARRCRHPDGGEERLPARRTMPGRPVKRRVIEDVLPASLKRKAASGAGAALPPALCPRAVVAARTRWQALL